MKNNKILWWVIAAVAGVALMITLIRFALKYAPQRHVTDQIKVNTTNLTFPETQYRMWTIELLGAMEGAGTNEKVIFAIFSQLQTADDYQMLVKSFGIKEVKKWWGYSFSGTLPAFLQNELSGKDLQKLNSIVAKIGVTI